MSCIRDWPVSDRPREKLLSAGPTTLTDTELLALILRTGHPGGKISALDLSRQLFVRFGTLRAIASAAAGELCEIPGIGPAKAAEILALGELARRFTTTPISPGDRFSNSGEVFAHFHERLRDLKKEMFFSLLLDSKNRLIREVRVSEGSLNASIVHPREVFQTIIRESAAAVLFVHNHPSGDPSPSHEDLELTSRLNEAGSLMGVRVLDHIIIGNSNYVSLADRGLLS